jgi:hypothetical protein
MDGGSASPEDDGNRTGRRRKYIRRQRSTCRQRVIHNATGAAIARRSSNTGVTVPLDLRHFAGHHIDLERPEAANGRFSSLDGNLIVAGRQLGPKMSLLISGE